MKVNFTAQKTEYSVYDRVVKISMMKQQQQQTTNKMNAMRTSTNGTRSNDQLIHADYDLPPSISYVDATRVCAAVEQAIEKLQLQNVLTTDVASLANTGHNGSESSATDGDRNTPSHFNIVVSTVLLTCSI